MSESERTLPPASSPSSAWDEEPSRQPTIVLDARGGLDLTALADEPLDPPPPPPAQSPPSGVELWMRTARERMELADFSGALELVEIDRNYKINRRDTNEYVARILPDALKLHCERILDLGSDVFEALTSFYLALPRVQ